MVSASVGYIRGLDQQVGEDREPEPEPEAGLEAKPGAEAEAEARDTA